MLSTSGVLPSELKPHRVVFQRQQYICVGLRVDEMSLPTHISCRYVYVCMYLSHAVCMFQRQQYICVGLRVDEMSLPTHLSCGATGCGDLH